jgi:hypothetical protein
VLRYYLRYGPDPLPDDGSLPELDWEGARYVENAILIGTPSGGSVLTLEQLVEGVNFASLITPTYRPAVLGTMPGLYQLLPRTRHARVVEAGSGRAIDVFDPGEWERRGWGLADPDQDGVLRQLLPSVEDSGERRAIALDHLAKSLAKAEQLHRALDVPAAPPEGLSMALIAGDAHPTPDTMEVDGRTGRGAGGVDGAGGQHGDADVGADGRASGVGLCPASAFPGGVRLGGVPDLGPPGADARPAVRELRAVHAAGASALVGPVTGPRGGVSPRSGGRATRRVPG